MTRLVRSLLALSLLALIASPLTAEDKPAKKPQKKVLQPAQPQVIGGPLAAQLKKISLTDEQKKEIEEIKAKYGPKLAEIQKNFNSSLTREQRQARREAQEKAKAEGKKGPEAKAAVEAALQLTDEQKEKLAERDAQAKKLQGEIREAVLGVLTDEQKTAIEPKKRPKIKAKLKAKNE